jgi:hypothetical protein
MRRRSLGWICLLAAGCSDPARSPISAPSYDPDAITKKCLAEFDENKDGVLAGGEIDRSPALKQAVPFIDTNKDKRLSGDELSKRFQMYQTNAAGAVGVSVRVLNGEVPIEGAVVTFIPEEFLKDTIQGGSGTTDKTGTATITGEGSKIPGLPAGLYRITVVKGTEISPRYSQTSTLGREIAAGGGRDTGSATFDIQVQK